MRCCLLLQDPAQGFKGFTTQLFHLDTCMDTF